MSNRTPVAIRKPRAAQAFNPQPQTVQEDEQMFTNQTATQDLVERFVDATCFTSQRRCHGRITRKRMVPNRRFEQWDAARIANAWKPAELKEAA